MTSINTGITAFREAYVSAGDDSTTQYDFTSYSGRRLRYSLYQSLYDASVYRAGVHGWSASMRQQYGLYRYIRQIEAPASTIVTFWQTHLFGGTLDPLAGDGSARPSAIPILTDNAALRQAIAQVWDWSNWATKKDTFALDGAKLGDVGLRIVDDVARQKTYLQIVHPSSITDLTLDPFGNVKGYTFEDMRTHPLTGRAAVYREVVSRQEEYVVYQTYLDKEPYAWPANLDADGVARQNWREPYGFVPFVWVNHIDTGTEFGLSELHQGLAAFRELDDVSSALDDQIRKAVAAPWFLAGVEDPKLRRSAGADPSIPQTAATATNPVPGRQEMPLLYAPIGATATPMVFPLDIAGTNTRIEALHAKLRRDYPELDADLATDSGDASGRALRVKRQRAEVKVNLRRSTYDDALMRAHKMAVALAGWRRWKGFEAFNLESEYSGALDHQIGERAVFATSVMDGLEEDQAFWTAAQAAGNAGYPLELYLRDHQWADERIAAYIARQIAPVAPPTGEQIAAAAMGDA